MTVAVGQIKQEVISILNLNISPCTIFWGESNRQHVEHNHPATYQKYGTMLESVIRDILDVPDYVGYRNKAIEYIKTMPDKEILKVAVRASKQNIFFVRTIYPIWQNELDSFLANKTLVKTR
ncbi:MAG: hypothetical protein LBQ58_02765 [Synergistaceae bacterium]|jgi:hypothetical protein|nr:hypothetical protein [Synergistaceae bacterium]